MKTAQGLLVTGMGSSLLVRGGKWVCCVQYQSVSGLSRASENMRNELLSGTRDFTTDIFVGGILGLEHVRAVRPQRHCSHAWRFVQKSRGAQRVQHRARVLEKDDDTRWNRMVHKGNHWDRGPRERSLRAAK